jgi:hypothetical protein
VDGPGVGAVDGGTLSGFTLLDADFDGPAGVAPEAVRFFPAVGIGTGRGPSNGPSKTALRPINKAEDMK